MGVAYIHKLMPRFTSSVRSRVARGQRGNDAAQPHAQHARLQKHQRYKRQHLPVWLYRRIRLRGIVDQEHRKERELHKEVDQFG